jgi:hypothetical protein
VERLVGSLRRKLLDEAFLWNAVDLEKKLLSFQLIFSNSGTHMSLGGKTPDETGGDVITHPISLCNYTWEKDCGGLYVLPVAA